MVKMTSKHLKYHQKSRNWKNELIPRAHGIRMKLRGKKYNNENSNGKVHLSNVAVRKYHLFFFS